MFITLHDIAQRFIGIKEIRGQTDNPHVMAMLKLDMDWPEHDEVAWCSAFLNYCAWLLKLSRSKSLRARSWLLVGVPVPLEEAIPAFDVVVLKRGGANQPGPEVIKAQGHVGVYASHDEDFVYITGGNQNNRVSLGRYPVERILGIRRLRVAN